MANDTFYQGTQFTVEDNRIFTMNSCDQIRAFYKIDPILFTPLDLFVISVAFLHF